MRIAKVKLKGFREASKGKWNEMDYVNKKRQNHSERALQSHPITVHVDDFLYIAPRALRRTDKVNLLYRYHTEFAVLYTIPLNTLRPSEIVRGYLWKCLCESQCQWHRRLTHILHLKVPYEECLHIVQQPQITASKQYVVNILERETCSQWPLGIYTLFSLNPKVIITKWNLRYHWREDSSVYRLP